MKVSNTRTHVFIGVLNPFIICDQCKNRVPYRHSDTRCGCDNGVFNYPCEHATGVTSLCSSWEPVLGCKCKDKETHDK
jgi:hypothetical protein